MAATHTIARRKPATYGKTSRNQLPSQLSSPAFDAIAPTLNLPSPPSRTLPTRPTTSNCHLPSDHNTPESQGIIDLPKPKPSSARLPQSPNDHHRPKKRVVDAWDVSSSDEEYDRGHTTGLAQARKRRKRPGPRPAASAVRHQPQQVLLSGGHGTSSPGAILDCSDQCLEILPSILNSSQALTLSLGQVSIEAASAQGPDIGQGTRPGPACALEPRNSLVSHRQCSPGASPSIQRRSTKAAISVSPSEVDKTPSPSTTSRGTTSQHSNDLRPAKRSPPSTPRAQTSMKNPVEATTPHQQELWSMLLPHVIQYPTPTCAASLSLESLDRTGSANFSTTAESINIVNCGAPLETKTPSCRRRLIDGLQPANRHIQKSLGNRQQRAISADLDEGDSPASKDGPSLSLDDRSGGSDRKRVESSDVGNPLVPQIGQHRLLPGNGHKVTYSSQRSHLGNVGMDDTSSFDVRLSVDGMPADDLFTCQRIQDRAPIFSAAASTETSKVGSDGLQNSSMRTIYELRESGETVRQINDMEALLDDLNGPGLTPVGLKRARLLELARRTQEPASCRLLLDQGFDSRLLKMSASGTSDAVTDILLASIILHFVAAPFGAQAMSHLNDPSVAALFGTRLKDDNDLIDIAQSRRSNISKRILSELKDYFGAFSHSSVWRSGYPIKVSSRVIGLQGLEHLVRRRREAGCKTDILPTETIRQLVDVMPLRDAALSTPRSADQLLEIRLALSILESCTTNGAGRDVSQWAGATLAPLLAILPKLSGTSLGAGEETQRLALRLYLNLTNNNPRLCQEFARTELIRSILDVVKMHSQVLSRPATNQQNSDPAALDTLILALGTLINLVEWSAAVRHIMAGQAGKNECFLDTLVGLFAARLNIVAEVYSEEETSSNVAFGYLAVLLAYLSIDEEARAMVANQLSGGSVQQLVGVVEEFLQYHRQIEDELVLKEGDVDLRTSFVGRLEKVLARLTDVA